MENLEEPSQIISLEAELNNDPIEDNFWEVLFKDGIFTATSNADGSVRQFELTKTPEQLNDDERYDVLHYNLSKVTKEDKVELRDIFLHAEFIKELK
jgi:hypothetical protein